MTVIDFGKYKGISFRSPEIPTAYLKWIVSQWEPRITAAKLELERRESTEYSIDKRKREYAAALLAEKSVEPEDRAWAESVLGIRR